MQFIQLDSYTNNQGSFPDSQNKVPGFAGAYLLPASVRVGAFGCHAQILTKTFSRYSTHTGTKQIAAKATE